MDTAKFLRMLLVLMERERAVLTQLMEEEEEVTQDLMNMLGNRQHISRKVWTYKRYGNFWEQDVPRNSEEFFKESFRMERSIFNLLTERLQGLKKKDTRFRKAIPLDKRIAIALYSFGSSAEYRTVGRLFGVSKVMVCKILNEFCQEVIDQLAAEYLPPNFVTQAKIDDCLKGFEALGFPQCFGAIDGCHIEIRPTADEAIDHYNYKGWYSIVLFASVDYRFQYINVGCPGRCHDSQIFEQSQLKKLVDTEPLFKSNAKDICGTKVPVLLIGDSAFRFSKHLMKPYPFSTVSTDEQRSFNFALSSARRVVECAFGHLKARFRRIGKGLDNSYNNNKKIIVCCCILHNLLNESNSVFNEKWQTELNSSRAQPEHTNLANDLNESAEEIRKAIAKYIMR